MEVKKIFILIKQFIENKENCEKIMKILVDRQSGLHFHNGYEEEGIINI